jgi:glycosyltransferase involved in cell wall biosynthesis
MKAQSNKSLKDPVVPTIAEVPGGVDRPLWSVMIPTHNCARYLPETLRSVLSQAMPPEQMQIEVIDDCSTLDDPEVVVKEIGGDRVSFFRKKSNEGATRTFNSCIERSKGQLVHILHGDDAVQPGYYAKISGVASRHPELGLYATRCLIFDEGSEITGVGPRVKSLESPSKSVDALLYVNPFHCPGVTVRRRAYEQCGGFSVSLVYAADWEMWTRVISTHGGVMLSQPLALYRHSGGNDSGRLAKIGENVRDLCRLNEIFSRTYPEFSLVRGRERARSIAEYQYFNFLHAGDRVAANRNLQVWIELTPFRDRVVFYLKAILQRWKHKIFSRTKST